MYRVLSRTDLGYCEELRKALHSHDANDQRRYIEEILKARFSLCPRGLSPSSYRLYESMQLGRAPVVISDDWVSPPGPDWDSFAIFIPESKIKSLPKVLESYAKDAERRGRHAQSAWKEFFSWPRRWTYFMQQVSAFHESRPLVLSFAELHDIWLGHEFLRCYEWTMPSRMKNFILRKLRNLFDRPFPAMLV
jgi:hypothetical protein